MSILLTPVSGFTTTKISIAGSTKKVPGSNILPSISGLINPASPGSFSTLTFGINKNKKTNTISPGINTIKNFEITAVIEEITQTITDTQYIDKQVTNVYNYTFLAKKISDNSLLEWTQVGEQLVWPSGVDPNDYYPPLVLSVTKTYVTS